MGSDRTERDNPDMDKLVETLRGIMGALNSRGVGDDNPVLVEIATLKIEVRHLRASLAELKRMLWGLAAGVFGLIIKMIIEGSLLK